MFVRSEPGGLHLSRRGASVEMMLVGSCAEAKKSWQGLDIIFEISIAERVSDVQYA